MRARVGSRDLGRSAGWRRWAAEAGRPHTPLRVREVLVYQADNSLKSSDALAEDAG